MIVQMLAIELKQQLDLVSMSQVSSHQLMIHIAGLKKILASTALRHIAIPNSDTYDR